MRPLSLPLLGLALDFLTGPAVIAQVFGACVISPDARPALLVLNGSACYRRQPSQRDGRNFVNVDVSLVAGPNPVLVAGWGQNAALHLHFMDAEGRPMPGLAFPTSP